MRRAANRVIGEHLVLRPYACPERSFTTPCSGGRNKDLEGTVSQSMRHAFRRLVSTPAFSLTAAITLAAAIGANALIFSIVNGVLLKPLPFERPETLVGVWHVAPGLVAGTLNQAPSTYFLYREQAESFEDIGLWDNTSVTLTGRGEPQDVEAMLVTDGLLPILGVRPVLGRTFTRADDTPGGP